jgi:pimeloyl-ACP methyl ester carboxylesterase
MALTMVPRSSDTTQTSSSASRCLAARLAPRAACVVALFLFLAACAGGASTTGQEPSSAATRWASHVHEAENMEAHDVSSVAQSPVEVDGRRFMTKCVGNGDGSVLLVSGWTAPMEEWEEVQAKVGSVARVCSYDRLGIGESGPLPPRQTFTTFAADIDHLIDALKLRRPIVIVGQSLGGPIAMTWATSHIGDTAGVVLVDAPDATFFEWQAHAMTDEQKANLYDPMASAADDAEHVDRPAAYPELAHLASLDPLPLEILTHDPDSPNGIESDLFDGVPKKATSQAWRDAQHRWQAFSSSSELVTVNGAGHNIQQDDPNAVVAAILAALR